MIDRLEEEGRVVLRYCDEAGEVTDAANPNGAQRNIAGICDETGRILGLMPHPERLFELALGGTDGRHRVSASKRARGRGLDTGPKPKRPVAKFWCPLFGPKGILAQR